MYVDWLADVLRAAGVPVVEYAGWKTRSASGSFAPRGVIWHHDASPMGPSPTLPHMIAEVGNATTPPPLSQCWVDTAGVWTVTAAGRANHAGIGSGWGRIRANQGNQDAIGIETDHTTGEQWPAAQISSLRRGTKAILQRLGASPADSLCGHKEYAPGRKTDPDGLDMATERRIVAGPIEEEDDMFDDTDKGKLAGIDRSLGYTFAASQRLAGEVILSTERLVIETLAAVREDLDAETVLARLEAVTRQAVTETVLPAIEQIRDALAEDNTSQAKAVVDELVDRLRPAA